MAGIYVHIPFCKSRCLYCGFYSTTHREWQAKYVDAVIREHALRSDYLRDEQIQTLYIGGGTPSQLSPDLLERLLNHFFTLTNAESQPEVTVECNPDDITPALATLLYNIGVNRISMGVQTFSDERLRFLRRRHNASEARKAVETLRNVGFRNISIDLMFGFPGETMTDWQSDISEACALGIEHISAYSLMYEEGTPLYRMLEHGEVEEIDEETSLRMYYYLIDRLSAAGYEHYEISNFAKPGFRSRHNSSYWNETHYLGLGAAAHSYNGVSRQWNIADIERYIASVEAGSPDFEIEAIDELTRYNDLITTALRTADGLPIDSCIYRDYLLRCAQPLIDRSLLVITPQRRLRLTREGLYTSDDIMSELIKI